MNKQTLIIDGHNFYFRTLFTLTKSKGDKILDTQEDQDIFEEKLISDWYYTINKYKDFITDIVVVVDSRSWRKDLILSDEYKGTRTTEEKVNFTNFYNIIEKFNSLLKDNGIKVSKVDSCEGDDLIYSWSSYLKSNNQSVFILSTDKDLTQLLDTEDCMISQYNPVQNVLYMTEFNYNKLQDRKNRMAQFSIDDLFNSDVVTKTEFEKFISNSGCKIQVVDTEKVRFNKVISGDSGDNVISVYRKQTESGRMLGIGDKKCEKIFEEFKSALNDNNITYTYYIQEYSDKNKLLDIIYDVCKINDPAFTKRMLQDNINTNGKLVILSSSTIPDYIISRMNKNIDDLKDVTLKFNPKNNSKEYWYNQTRFKDKVSGTIIKQKANSLKFVNDEDDFSFLTD